MKEKTGRGRYLDALADAVVDWMEQNQPAGASAAGVTRQDAVAYLLSVVGTLTQVAANMTQGLPAVGATMTEDQFVSLARARFRVARETHGPPAHEPVEWV